MLAVCGPEIAMQWPDSADVWQWVEKGFLLAFCVLGVLVGAGVVVAYWRELQTAIRAM